MLRHPDVFKSFQLYTTWNSLGLGAVLTRNDDFGHEYVVAYASQSNNMTEANYSSYKGETLAAVWAIVHFQPYFMAIYFGD